MNIINTCKPYDYEALKMYIKDFKMHYSLFEVGSIGRSELGRELFYIRLGRGKNHIFYNGSHATLY